MTAISLCFGVNWDVPSVSRGIHLGFCIHCGSQHGLPSPVWPRATGAWKITDSESPRPTAKRAVREVKAELVPGFGTRQALGCGHETTTRRPPAPPTPAPVLRTFASRPAAPLHPDARPPPRRVVATGPAPARARRLRADPPHPRPLQGRVSNHAPPRASRGVGARPEALTRAGPRAPRTAARSGAGEGGAPRPPGPGPAPGRPRPHGCRPGRGPQRPSAATLAGHPGHSTGTPSSGNFQERDSDGHQRSTRSAQTETRSAEALGDRAGPCPQEGRRPPRRSAESRRAGLRGAGGRCPRRSLGHVRKGVGPPRSRSPRPVKAGGFPNGATRGAPGPSARLDTCLRPGRAQRRGPGLPGGHRPGLQSGCPRPRGVCTGRGRAVPPLVGKPGTAGNPSVQPGVPRRLG
ncbi:translation initiation factor IF-2-like [Lutra lutra]|uniref:translation initiation factor IF-2-like n=1 Tax=Lutra lutra TaxID=9657 RepID=UPI001FD45F00|nr:translation initiation factor IF-2-like [Lutra lutra]